jgi:hypothetical protein
LQLERLDAHDNIYGVTARRAQLTDSTVTPNSYADVLTWSKPALTNSTCDHSVRLRRTGLLSLDDTWGVCAGD